MQWARIKPHSSFKKAICVGVEYNGTLFQRLAGTFPIGLSDEENMLKNPSE